MAISLKILVESLPFYCLLFTTFLHTSECFNLDPGNRGLLCRHYARNRNKNSMEQKFSNEFKTKRNNFDINSYSSVYGSRNTQMQYSFDDLTSDPKLIGAASAGLIAIGFAILKASIYWRMQYITAAMLSRRIAGKNLNIVEVGATNSKNMYYYPAGAVRSVTIVGKDINPGIAKSSGQQLGITSVSVKECLSEELPSLGRSVADVVVSTQGLKQFNNFEGAMKRISEAIKPQGSFVFVEQLSGIALSEESINKAIMDTNMFESFDYDIVQNLGSPYIVGFAVRAGNSVKEGVEVQSSSSNSEGNRKMRRKKKPAKK